MGNSASRNSPRAFRIIRINKNGPADKTELEVFFDFIVEAGGCDVTTAEDNPEALRKAIEDSVGEPLKLIVYSARLRSFRDVYLTPAPWGGQGFLGAGVQFEPVENVMQEGLRVIEVFQNSPAAVAGLIPYKDFLIATEEGLLRTMDDLVSTVNDNIDKEMSFLVFNTNTEKIREVKITANYKWGGSSRFGCDVGTGYLHYLPLSRAADLDLLFNFSGKFAALSMEKCDSPPQLVAVTAEPASNHENSSNYVNAEGIYINEKLSSPPFTLPPVEIYHPPVLDGERIPLAPTNSSERRNDEIVQEDISRTDFSSNSRLVTGGSTQASFLTDRDATNNPFVVEPSQKMPSLGSAKIQEKYNHAEAISTHKSNETEPREPSLLSADSSTRYTSPPKHVAVEPRSYGS
ncbi:gorasp2-prov protein [Cardiosporidium cionae]|uniref:Gorasp2-prov protein n=1 Tax=Cardiosporidium cionae TaxID=476202 RepID=A0ABQ7JC49_9APIC|nr:gorasp2-prov protein [Cardiosporidium cionae]|eukprot:KAF8821505.1 gorasp2-prov protein [Cardiosporidium cionae]